MQKTNAMMAGTITLKGNNRKGRERLVEIITAIKRQAFVVAGFFIESCSASTSNSMPGKEIIRFFSSSGTCTAQ